MSDPAHGKEEKKKKSIGAMLGGVAAVILILIVFFYFTGATIPILGDAFTGTVSGFGTFLSNFGRSELVVARGIDDFGHGFREILMSTLKALLVALVLGAIIFLILDQVKKKTGGAAHGAEHH